MRTGAHVGQVVSGRQHQQVAYARPMYLDAEIVTLRMRGRERREVFAVAEADLERAWRRTAKQRVEGQHRGRVLHAVTWPEILERARLAGGHAAGAHHETADGAISKFVHSASG